MKNFYFLTIITVFCLINSVCAEDIEDFYIIHVAGPSEESRLEKRQEGLNFNTESAISQFII